MHAHGVYSELYELLLPEQQVYSSESEIIVIVKGHEQHNMNSCNMLEYAFMTKIHEANHMCRYIYIYLQLAVGACVHPHARIMLKHVIS